MEPNLQQIDDYNCDLKAEKKIPLYQTVIIVFVIGIAISYIKEGFNLKDDSIRVEKSFKQIPYK